MGKRYHWSVILRNDKQGYQKSFAPVAYDYIHAATEAKLKLGERGYKPAEFNVISITRGQEASQ